MAYQAARDDPAKPAYPTSPALVAARRMQSLNKSRSRMLGNMLFADPAWDIMLDLFVCSAQQRRLSVSAVGIGISGSLATALRYIGLLQSQGLVLRTPDPTDGRRSFVELTDAGLEKLDLLLTQFAAPLS